MADWLRADGLMIICRTEPTGENHGTVFRKRADGALAVLDRLGRGSEIELLVLQG
jgi:hypothetical protein